MDKGLRFLAISSQNMSILLGTAKRFDYLRTLMGLQVFGPDLRNVTGRTPVSAQRENDRMGTGNHAATVGSGSEPNAFRPGYPIMRRPHRSIG